MLIPQLPETLLVELLPRLPALLLILNFSLAATVATPGAVDEKVTAGVVALEKEYVSAPAGAGAGAGAAAPAGAGAGVLPPPPPPQALKVAVIATKANKFPNFIPKS